MYAFRKRRSCVSTLLNMVEDSKDALHKGNYFACISSDQSKAFDCLPHCLPVAKWSLMDIQQTHISELPVQKQTVREDQ